MDHIRVVCAGRKLNPLQSVAVSSYDLLCYYLLVLMTIIVLESMSVGVWAPVRNTCLTKYALNPGVRQGRSV